MERPLFDPDRVRGPEPAAGPRPAALLTVSQVTGMVKQALADHMPPTIHVVGQVSNFKRHSSGHIYLTLKDDRSELSCVMWKSAAVGLKFKPVDGLEVVATGGIDVFERTGRYQLYIRKLEPRGVGALELAFRQLHEKLQADGLFDPAHKKSLPRFPIRIGVVTSPTGAAIRDILRTLHRRYPAAEVFLMPVAVQGPTAAGEIAAAIRLLDRRHDQIGGLDVLIVGRGGGSLEDLWAFNEEAVARAIFACRIPVVSAVGHETDVTISDLVADVRAATPTAAAELVAPDARDVLAGVGQCQARITRSVTHRLELLRAGFKGLLHRGAFRDPLTPVQQREQVIDELTPRMSRAMTDRLHTTRQAVSRCEVLLQRIHPRSYVAELGGRLADRRYQLERTISRRLTLCERLLARRMEALVALSPGRRIGPLAERLDRFDRRLLTSVERILERAGSHIHATAEKLQAMSYRTTLTRGFSITRTKRDRHVVRDGTALKNGDRLLTETAGGEVESQVVRTKQMDLFE